MLYHGDDYYPEHGGLGDFVESFDSKKECIEKLLEISESKRKDLGYDFEDYWDSRWATVLDTETWDEQFIEQEELTTLIQIK